MVIVDHKPILIECFIHFLVVAGHPKWRFALFLCWSSMAKIRSSFIRQTSGHCWTYINSHGVPYSCSFVLFLWWSSFVRKTVGHLFWSLLTIN